MRSKTSYSMEEKQQLVNEFAKSGLTKWEFTRLHPEYKRPLLIAGYRNTFLAQQMVMIQQMHQRAQKSPKTA